MIWDKAASAQEPVPFGLRVVEEPPIDDVGFTATSAAPKPEALPVAGTPTPVTGGAGFDTAPALTAGSWSSTIVPGEFDLFRIHLDYGQSARISITFPAVSDAVKKKIETDYDYSGIPTGQLALYSPMRAELGVTDGSVFAEEMDDVTFTSSIPQVSAAPFEEPRRRFSGGADVGLPGDYYIGFGAGTKPYSFEFPFTITVAIDGTAQSGPTYAGGVSWTLEDGLAHGVDQGSSASASPSSDADPVSKADHSDGGDGGLSAGGAAGLAVVILALLGGGGWWFSHRARAGDQGSA